jgi:hypothetical protein
VNCCPGVKVVPFGIFNCSREVVPRITRPVIFNWSAVVAVISTMNLLVLVIVRAVKEPLLMFSTPMAPAVAPALIADPLELTITPPFIFPLPLSVPVPLTVTVPVPVEDVALLANSVPALTVVPPV